MQESVETRRRRSEVELQLRELELEKRKGQLVAVSSIKPYFEELYTVLRSRLLSFPPKLAPLVSPGSPTEAQKLLDDAVNEILEEIQSGKVWDDLRRRFREDRDGRGSSEREEVLPETFFDSERMGGQVSSSKSRSKRRARSVDHEEGSISKGDDGLRQRSNGSHSSGHDGKSGGENRTVSKRRRLFHPPRSSSNSNGGT